MLVKILIAVLIFAVLLGLFILVFLLNKKAKAPADCAKDQLPEGCASCMLACQRREDEFKPTTLLKDKNNKSQDDADPADEAGPEEDN